MAWGRKGLTILSVLVLKLPKRELLIANAHSALVAVFVYITERKKRSQKLKFGLLL